MNSRIFHTIYLLLFLLLLNLLTRPVVAQQHQPLTKSYVHFYASGILKTDTTIENNLKKIKITTLAGFLEIRPAKDFFEQDLFFNGEILSPRTATGKPQVITMPRDTVMKTYLVPGKSLQFDIREKSTGRTIARYEVDRPRFIPKLRIGQFQDGMFHLYSVNNDSLPWSLQVKPGAPIMLEPVGGTRFPNEEISYTLINLSTKRKTNFSGKKAIDLPALSAKTDYELFYRYTAQRETFGRIILKTSDRSAATWLYPVATGLVIVSILLAAFLFWFWRKNKVSKRRQQKLEDAALALQTSLNPHFTFNALSTIQGLMNTGNIDKANEYLQEFGSLLRKTLSKSQQVYNSLDQEIEMMRLYLRLEEMRFNFSWDIFMAPELNASTIEIPTLLLQPIIENSVKHGVSSKHNKGRIELRCEPLNNSGSFMISIQDNGAWKDSPGEQGFGLSLTRQRIKTINKLRKDSLIEMSSSHSEGTFVKFIFNNWI